MNLDEEDVYYSPSERGFFYLSIHGPSMPADSRKISKELADEVRIGQLTGTIMHDAQGMPYVAPRVVSKEDQIRILNIKVENYLDATAAKYGYKSMDQAVTFAEDATIAQYQKEGIALRSWRSKVYAYTEAQIKAGNYDFVSVSAGFPALTI